MLTDVWFNNLWRESVQHELKLRLSSDLAQISLCTFSLKDFRAKFSCRVTKLISRRQNANTLPCAHSTLNTINIYMTNIWIKSLFIDQVLQTSSTRAASLEPTRTESPRPCVSCAEGTPADSTNVRWAAVSGTTATKELSGK